MGSRTGLRRSTSFSACTLEKPMQRLVLAWRYACSVGRADDPRVLEPSCVSGGKSLSIMPSSDGSLCFADFSFPGLWVQPVEKLRSGESLLW